jgi:hypothetical protein
MLGTCTPGTVCGNVSYPIKRGGKTYTDPGVDLRELCDIVLRRAVTVVVGEVVACERE